MITIRELEIYGVQVHVVGEECDPAEIEQYVQRGVEMYGKELKGVDIVIDGEYVDINYFKKPVPFDRIRRVTGYLGHLKGFNNGKSAEEHDRLKHGMEEGK